MFIESVFESQQLIPVKYTCDGENVSPPLKFMEVPSKTVSLVLIVDDPDAPRGTFDHWILWNISPQVKEFTEGGKEISRLSPAPLSGINGYGNLIYKGPCPPAGKPHHYHFKLYALDTLLSLKEGAFKQEVEKAMNGHILAEAELVGIYQRS